jgi:hypothetical protein
MLVVLTCNRLLLSPNPVPELAPNAGLAKSGEKLNGGVIKVSPSKTPIVPINREFMPRDEKELERCERTVYVNQIDRAVPGSAVEAMFENFCGASIHVSISRCSLFFLSTVDM